MNKAKRYVALIMAIFTFVGFLPLDVMVAYAAPGDIQVTRMDVTRTFKGLNDNSSVYTIRIIGKNLAKGKVAIITSGTGTGKIVKETLTANSILDIELENSTESIQDIVIDGEIFSFDESESGMPRFNQNGIDPNHIDVTDQTKDVKISMENQSNINNQDIKMTVNNVDVKDIFSSTTVDPSDFNKFGRGWKSIVITKDGIVNSYEPPTEGVPPVIKTSVPTKIQYVYRDAFRLFESLKISLDDILIIPTMGKVQTPVSITFKDKKENYSVFFRENEKTDYTLAIMGEDIRHPLNSKSIELKVPKGLTPGKRYKMYITNDLSEHTKGKKPEDSLSNFITKEQYIGEFFVVDGTDLATIESISPKEGSSDGGKVVSIKGQNFSRIGLDGLNEKNPEIDKDKTKINSMGEPSSLEIEYKTAGLKYYQSKDDKQGKDVESIKKQFIVTIGKPGIFTEETKAGNIFNKGANEYLSVETPRMNLSDLVPPEKEVTVLITTTVKIEGNDTPIIFSEFVSNKDVTYKYLKASQDPEIKTVLPDKVQVVSENDKTTKVDSTITIDGSGFNVFRYGKEEPLKTSYPVVYLGGTGEGAEIKIVKKSNGELEYYTKSSATASDVLFNLSEESKKAMSFNVYDKNGKIIDGTDNNDEGTTIVVTIPKGLPIQNINTKQAVAVANPIRDVEDKTFPPSYKSDLITFITTSEGPKIESIEPDKVTTAGGEDMLITGTNFRNGVKVYVDGKEITGVKKDINKETTKEELRFKAPKNREGVSIVMVQNPDGGTDSTTILYIESTDFVPKITTIVPNKGTVDDLIIIKGNNFIKGQNGIKDLSGIGIDKLLGSTIYIGGKDVNEYIHQDKRLVDYTMPTNPTGPIYKVVTDPLSKTKYFELNNLHKDAILKSSSKVYEIKRTGSTSLLIQGDTNEYNIILENDIEKAIDREGKRYNVLAGVNDIILESEDGSESLIFDIAYDTALVSIRETITGGKVLSLSSQYSSIILKDEDTQSHYRLEESRGKFYLQLEGDEKLEVREINGQLKIGDYDLIVNDDSIEYNNKTLKFQTPYKIVDGVIVGHRAKVIDTTRIEVTVPRMPRAGLYDVKVVNPDTRSHTLAKSFEYLNPRRGPAIYKIDPPTGDVDGGYTVKITGEFFTSDMEIYIDGVKATNVKVDSSDFKTAYATVPKYTGDINESFLSKVPVWVHLVNKAGQAASKELFAYTKGSSEPNIKIVADDKTGPTSGGEVIRINGKHIMFHEPYNENKVPDENAIPGVDFEDIDGDGKWTNYLSGDEMRQMGKTRPLGQKAGEYEDYLDSPVLPTIYFGEKIAYIVNFERGLEIDSYLIEVVLPEGDPGQVDVYLVNPDRGVSNKDKFRYIGIAPKLNPIVPPYGNRQGGNKVPMSGEGIKEQTIKVIDKSGEKEKTMTLIKFGDVSNKNHTKDKNIDTYGQITGGKAKVDFKHTGNLKAEYSDKNLNITITEGNKTYSGKFQLESGTKYIDVKNLKNTETGEEYKGFELIKAQISLENRLIIERGYSPEVTMTTKNDMEVIIPSYYKIGKTGVKLVNRDGESKEVPFEYTNAQSRPKITNIKKNGEEPIEGDNGGFLAQYVPLKGRNIITIEGEDFLTDPNPTVIIGKDIVIKPEDITYVSSKEIYFELGDIDPKLENQMLAVSVINKDKEVAISTNSKPPIYIIPRSGETEPVAGNIIPDRGPVSGGTIVTIYGTEFRTEVEGFDGEFKVSFGGVDVPKEDIISVETNKIVVKTPRGKAPGKVRVVITNPDGNTTRDDVWFTYISEPVITGTKPDSMFINDVDNLITIEGHMFMQGAVVLVNGVEIKDVKFINDKTLEVKFPVFEEVPKEVVIQVINPDGGKSNEYRNFRYEDPIPLRPLVLEGIPGYEGTVALVWSKSDPNLLNKATEFEIYGREISNSNNTFIANTTDHEYLVKGLKPNTEYEFLVRAINQYGAAIDFAKVKVKTLSLQEDYKEKEKQKELDKLLKEVEEKGKETIAGNKATLVLGKESMKKPVDLSLTKYKNVKNFEIKVPLGLARQDFILNIKDNMMNLNINPRDLYTYKVSTLDKGNKDAYMIIEIGKERLTNIPRNKRVAGEEYGFIFNFQTGTDKTEIDKMLRPASLSLKVDTVLYPNPKNPKIHKFNPGKGSFEPVGQGVVSIDTKGKYIILSDR